ncbi:MAG: hypothetical protein BGO48_00085 [Mucilaginibacter sp. 44-25]|nr:MAG: hypothetical protein BGO48_00085 [Mucilaginibacter sp. 44-25]
MEIFKKTLQVVFGTAIVLNVLTAIMIFYKCFAGFIGTLLFYFNFIDNPLFIIFLVVLITNSFLRKRPFSIFRTELIFLLIHILATTLLIFSYSNCPGRH